MSAATNPVSAAANPTASPQSAPDSFTRAQWTWLRQVQADRELTPFAFLVGFAIADHTNRESGEAWPSQATIAEKVGGKERGVRSAVEQLARRGHLQITTPNGRKGVNHYRLCLQTGGDVHRHGHDDKPTLNRHDDAGEQILHGHVHDGEGSSGEVYRHGHAALTGTTMPPNCLNEPSDTDSESMPPPTKARRQRLTPKPKTSDVNFDEFWLQVPKAVGKADARRAYDKATTSGAVTHQEIMLGIARYAAERQGEDPKYTKHPATWLNKGCWSDAPAQQHAAPVRHGSNRHAALQELIDHAERKEAAEREQVRRRPNATQSRMDNANAFSDELLRRRGIDIQRDPIIIDNDERIMR